MTVDPLLPRARRSSRAIVAGTIAASVAAQRLAPGALGARAQSALVLGALALGMPHGAADTEVLRAAARGSRVRHVGLLAGYAAAAAAATTGVARAGDRGGLVVLAGSALHFAEGELACWAPPRGAAGRGRRTGAIRGIGVALATLGLQSAVALAGRSELAGGGGAGARARATGATVGAGLRRTGLVLLADRHLPLRRRVPLVAATGGAVVAAAALAARGDRAVAGDLALLTGLGLLTPPALSFAGYFGGWHAVRHTARLVDSLARRGLLAPPTSLPAAFWDLGRRSAWASGVGLVGVAALAVAQPRRAADAGLDATLGLTVPHAITVALALRERP